MKCDFKNCNREIFYEDHTAKIVFNNDGYEYLFCPEHFEEGKMVVPQS